MRVVIVSHDPTLADTVSACARDLGLTVTSWEPPTPPIRDAVVVVDARDGLELLEAAVRSLGRPRRLATVVVAAVRAGDTTLALDRDADDVVVWPAERALLTARLRVSVLRARRRISMDPRLAVALAHVGEAVELTDRRGRIEYVNQAFERKFGYRSEEVVGRTPAEFLRSGDYLEHFEGPVVQKPFRAQTLRALVYALARRRTERPTNEMSPSP